MRVVLTRELLERLSAEALEAAPREACGILLGQGTRIEAVRPAQNVHPTPGTHFEIDPQALIDAHRAARAGGPEVVGYYHSHPNGPAAPSACDRASRTGDGRLWAIVGKPGVAFWRDDESGFAKLSYSVVDG